MKNHKSALLPEIIDKVYFEFSNSAHLIGEPKLKTEDLYYLRTRDLEDEEIRKANIFSMPSKSVINKFLENLKSQGLENVLSEVPGFYYDTKIDNWSYFNLDSIVIPIRDEFGKVVALQLRCNDPLSKVRYIWFSSSFAAGDIPNEKGLCKGTSSGAPVSVMYAKEPSDTCAITEGWFKQKELTRLGFPTISTQGVYSINESVLDVLANMENIQKKNLKNIKIFYDADCVYNQNVLKAISKISLVLEKRYNVEVAIWDPDMGKGIDDYLINNTLDRVNFISSNSFRVLSNEVIAAAKAKNLKAKDTDIKNIFNQFYKFK